jgi:hypothetical protein
MLEILSVCVNMLFFRSKQDDICLLSQRATARFISCPDYDYQKQESVFKLQTDDT